MARIKDQSVRDVIAAAQHRRRREPAHVAAQGSGTRYMGRCPFHEERSPSFSVNADLNLYHCFGCGKGGDVVTFVRETEGLDFVGAIEWLAERFRVPLEYEESSPQPTRRAGGASASSRVLDQAAAFFERHLWEGCGRGARAGLPRRAAGSARRSRRSSGSASRPGHGLAAQGPGEGVHRGASCALRASPTSAATTTSRRG